MPEGEVSWPWLTLSEWQEAADGRRLNSTAISAGTDLEKHLFCEFKITYQTGKGNNHLVPILFPTDTIIGMQRLADPMVRHFAGIHDANVYAFHNSKHSMDHVRGWHSIHRVSSDVKIQCPELLNPTEM